MPLDRGPLADRIRELLADRPATREKSMFGGVSFMVNDKIIVNVRGGDRLLLRVDPRRSSELVGSHGALPAESGTGRTMGPGWVTVPPERTTSDADLRFWMDVAMEFHDAATAHPVRRPGRRAHPTGT